MEYCLVVIFISLHGRMASAKIERAFLKIKAYAQPYSNVTPNLDCKLASRTKMSPEKPCSRRYLIVALHWSIQLAVRKLVLPRSRVQGERMSTVPRLPGIRN